MEPIKKPVTHDPTKLDPADMSSPKPMALSKDKKSLAIAIVVASVFLLAAAGVASWLFIHKSGSSDNVVTQIDPNSTTSVSTVNWVAPKMPDNFKIYDQSTAVAKVIYYASEATDCSITTQVVYDGDAVKTAADAVAVTAANKNAANTTAEEDEAVFNDADGNKTYNFTSASLSSEFNSPILGHRVLAGHVHFAHFGHNVAMVRFLCGAATAAANNDSLSELIKQFTLKTER